MTWSRKKTRKLLTVLALSLIIPFVWMVLTSLKTLAECGAGSWLPAKAEWENYPGVFRMENIQWDVILPLSRMGLVTLAIFTFIGNYHSFFWPLVMLKSMHRYTLPIGLLFFDSSQGQETNLLMAAITMSVVPMILVFVILQKRLVKGIQLGAVKG